VSVGFVRFLPERRGDRKGEAAPHEGQYPDHGDPRGCGHFLATPVRKDGFGGRHPAQGSDGRTTLPVALADRPESEGRLRSPRKLTARRGEIKAGGRAPGAGGPTRERRDRDGAISGRPAPCIGSPPGMGGSGRRWPPGPPPGGRPDPGPSLRCGTPPGRSTGSPPRPGRRNAP